MLQLTGRDSDMNLRATDHPEFDAWRWEDIDRLPDLIIPFKREVYLTVVESFRPLARGLGVAAGRG